MPGHPVAPLVSGWMFGPGWVLPLLCVLAPGIGDGSSRFHKGGSCVWLT